MPDRENGGDWEGRVNFWATAVVVPLFAYWIPTQFSISEALAWASTGALLGIAGLLRTSVSLDEKVCEPKGIPRFAQRLGRRLRRPFLRAWRWLKEKVRGKPERHVITPEPTTVKATAGSVGISQSPSEEPTLEVRVGRLEKQISLLRRRIGEVHTDAHQRAEKLEERLRKVRNDLREADRRQKDLLERVTVSEASCGRSSASAGSCSAWSLRRGGRRFSEPFDPVDREVSPPVNQSRDTPAMRRRQGGVLSAL